MGWFWVCLFVHLFFSLTVKNVSFAGSVLENASYSKSPKEELKRKTIAIAMRHQDYGTWAQTGGVILWPLGWIKYVFSHSSLGDVEFISLLLWLWAGHTAIPNNKSDPMPVPVLQLKKSSSRAGSNGQGAFSAHTKPWVLLLSMIQIRYGGYKPLILTGELKRLQSKIKTSLGYTRAYLKPFLPYTPPHTHQNRNLQT